MALAQPAIVLASLPAALAVSLAGRIARALDGRSIAIRAPMPDTDTYAPRS